MNTNLLSRKSPSSAPLAPPIPRSLKKKRHVWKVVLALIALFLVIAGIKAAQFAAMISAGKKMVPPPTTVTSAEAKKADWQPMFTAIGSVSPVQGAMISAELAGTVTEINFQSGAVVKKGDVLLKMDVSPELAQLRSAQADEELAKQRRRTSSPPSTRNRFARRSMARREFAPSIPARW